MGEVWEELVRIFAGNAILNHIADTCVTVSIVIVFLLLIRPLMKKLPRMGMYVLWFTVILRMLCPVTINGIYGVLPEKVEKSVAQTSEWVKVEEIAARIDMQEAKQYGGIGNGYRLRSGNVDRAEKKEEVTYPAGKVSDAITNADVSLQPERTQGIREILEGISPEKYMLGIWAAGVTVCLLCMMISLTRTKRKFMDAKRLRDNIYVHPLVENSFVGGLFSPKIYMAEGISEEDMEYILHHERMHVKRRDYLIKPFVFAVFSLMWFNPLIWIAWHFMMKDMEISCDEMAMKNLGHEARKKYSYLLLEMAGGERGTLSQNPAFSVGTVKERITNIMKYRKPTVFMTIAVCFTVALCSCGVISSPKEPEEKIGKQIKKDTYIEQGVWISKGSEKWSDYSWVRQMSVTMGNDGKMVQFVLLGEESNLEKGTYGKMVLMDGEWVKEDINWLEAFDKIFAGKNVELKEAYYSEDGYLYLYVMELGMSAEQEKIYEAEKEAWQKDKDNDMPEPGYDINVHNRILRVDEKSGQITEMVVPEEPVTDVYGDEMPPGTRLGMAPEKFAFFPDGNVFITNEGNIRGIYSLATGEKICEPDTSDRVSEVYAGDEFYCYTSLNQTSGNLDVKVFDMDGDRISAIPTGVKFMQKGRTNIAIGVKDTTILMACEDGIFEAAYNGDKFNNIAGYKTDNLYYLSPYSYAVLPGVYKGEDDEYYTKMFKYDPNVVYQGDEADFLLLLGYYSKEKTGE